jgi:hypothetical protein
MVYADAGKNKVWEPPTKQFYSDCQFSGDQPSSQSARSTAVPISIGVMLA